MTQYLKYLGAIKDNPAVWAQGCHCLIGYCAMLTWHRCFGAWGVWPAAITLALFFALLETWFDPRYEPDSFFWGGFTDLAFYLVGLGVGLAVVY